MNILDIVKNYLPANLAGQIAGATGENESGISKVISAALPTILGSLITKSSTNSGGVLDMVKGAASSGILGNLTSIIGGNEQTPATGGFNIWTILKSLLGDKMGGIVSMLSSFGGVKESTAHNVLGVTSAAALGAVGKYAADKNLDANGLTSFLGSQKGIISSLIPSGFDFGKIGSLLGLGGLGAAAASATTHFNPGTERVAYTQERKKSGNSWLVPLVILAALGGLIWWMTKDGCNKSTTVTSTNVDSIASTGMDTATMVQPAEPAPTGVRENVVLTLPSGATVNAYKGGIEDQLIQFIQSDEYKNAANDEALKSRWFNFDNLNFEFGTTKLTAESKVQLDNIVAILKEFKDVKIKVGAYTDKKGDDAGNKKLSQGRAEAVKAALSKSGVGAQVTAAEGYGEEFATVDENADDKAREADRKTAIRLVK